MKSDRQAQSTDRRLRNPLKVAEGNGIRSSGGTKEVTVWDHLGSGGIIPSSVGPSLITTNLSNTGVVKHYHPMDFKLSI